VAIGKQQGRKKWFSLLDKVFAHANLMKAWLRVAENGGAAGIDGMTVKAFAQDCEARLTALSNDLRGKTYRPQPVRRVYIPKSGGGKRPLGIPTVRDRIVQQALHQILSPIFEAKFSNHSHGFRPGLGCATALEVVDRAVRNGYEWIVDADIQGFFDNVDHELLLTAVNEEISDGSVLKLIGYILQAGIVEPDTWELEPSELGTPQGGPLSPLLANIYLHRLDTSMKGRYGLVRYADDFVLLTRSRSEAEAALALARGVLEGELKLRLHPDKTRIVHIDKGFDFLGYRYLRSKKGQLVKIVRGKSKRTFREKARALTPRDKSQRKPKARHFTLSRLLQNQRLRAIIEALNRFLRGWHGYFKHVWVRSDTAFRALDEYVRGRVRLVLTGRVGSGWWHMAIPNWMLGELKLVSLIELQNAYLTERRMLSARKG
jgi:RNA-directed DNA polymerase